VRLAFLGTGSAFSLERYNGAVVVDGRLLLDGGAPLLPHMHRLGIDPGRIQAVFITHYHGDHLLGLPTFMLHRAFVEPSPFVIVGPAGVESRLEQLFAVCWGSEWPEFRERSQVRYQEAGSKGEVAGVTYQTVQLDHGGGGSMGYRLSIGGRLLAYAGDSQATPPLDELVEGCDVAITEATGPGQVHSHTSWEEAAELAGRHPTTRFIFNHVYMGTPPGAAEDCQVIEL
jgi:ribonuclease BN (tRNA processing enzyme)